MIDNGKLLVDLHSAGNTLSCYPEATQIVALRYFLLYRLRGTSLSEVQASCKEMLDQIRQSGSSKSLVSDKTVDSLPIDESGSENLLLETNRSGHISDIDTSGVLQLEEQLKTLHTGLAKLAGEKNVENLSLDELLELVSRRQAQQERAMNTAAGKSFDRLLKSMNPDSAESYMDQSVVKVGPLKKAALFEALKEKFEQLSNYHQKGRLLRDFRVMFKTELKKFDKRS